MLAPVFGLQGEQAAAKTAAGVAIISNYTQFLRLFDYIKLGKGRKYTAVIDYKHRLQLWLSP